jgi:AraC family transcriptional activator of pobA
MLTPVTPRPPVESTTSELRLKGFKVYEVDKPSVNTPVFSRRDYYKVSLVHTKCLIHYAHQSLVLDGPHLFFSNPHVPYSMEVQEGRHLGYACLFTEEFVKAGERSESLQQSPLFQYGSAPLFQLTEAQTGYVTGIFQKMLTEQETDYPFKGELIRTYVQLLIHEALHMQPTAAFFQHKNAAARITALFLELLERQFPVEEPTQQLGLKTAQEFADRLAVHVNHLNRAVKEVTGKPTTAHLLGRLVDEAKALLLHTDWAVSEIAHCLGFEYPTYFNNFFKKHTGSTPLTFRRAQLATS